MGVRHLFRKHSPDFSDFSTTNQLGFDDINHVAKVKVWEDGTEAAAATCTSEFKSCRNDRGTPLLFNCNRPFVFMIFDRERNLFSGIFRDPKSMTFKD